MSDEKAFLDAIRTNPDDDTTRLVYADWLDEIDDPRGRFVRLHLALRSVAPDHVQRVACEQELSVLRSSLFPRWQNTNWFDVIEPERAHLSIVGHYGPRCACFEGLYGSDP